jgi:hypothetical protein
MIQRKPFGRFCAFLSSAVLLSGCASQSANYDYLPSTDFTQYEAFAWVQGNTGDSKSQRAKTPMVDQRIRDAVTSELTAKGFKQVERNAADFVVDYHVSVSQEEQRQPRGAVSIGSGRYSGGSSVGFSVAVPLGGNRTYKDGTLIIDMLDNKSNVLFWQGSGSRRVSDDLAPDRLTVLINEVVAEILAQFPPEKKR